MNDEEVVAIGIGASGQEGAGSGFVFSPDGPFFSRGFSLDARSVRRRTIEILSVFFLANCDSFSAVSGLGVDTVPTGKSRTGIPVFEIPVYRSEKHR